MPVADAAHSNHDIPGGLGNFHFQSWQIPVDDSPPPQRKRSTADSNSDQSKKGSSYEKIHVNYYEIHGQEGIWDDRAEHHRKQNDDDASLPEILLAVPAEEVHITQPAVVLDEQCSRSPLYNSLPKVSWKDDPPRGHSSYQRQPSMQSQDSNRTLRPSDINFSSCRNKENYPDYPPRHTPLRQFHWPTERKEVDDSQPKGLSDMYYETYEGKCTDFYFASISSSMSEPKYRSKPQTEPADNYNTWPSSSYDTRDPAVYEYPEKRRFMRPSVIPGSPIYGHARKASDCFSIETAASWESVTLGAPKAEVWEPESPAGEEVSYVPYRVYRPRKRGAKYDSG